MIEENHQYWRALVFYLVGAHDIEDYLTWFVQCPLSFVFERNDSSSEAVKNQNPQCLILKKYDKVLLSWLLASISEGMFSHVSQFTTLNEF